MDSAGGGRNGSDSTTALLNDLRRAATHIGDRILTEADYEEYGTFDVETVTRRFSDWHFALHKAGLIDEETVQNWEVERYDLIADVRRVAATVDGELTLNAYMNRGEYHENTVKKHLGDGSWPETLRAADLSGYGEERNDPSPPEDQTTLAEIEEMGPRDVAATPPAGELAGGEEQGNGDVLAEMPSPADRTLFQQVEDYQSESACPSCGESYSSLGLHWAQSAECGYPSLTPTQQEALRGVLLRHGSIEEAGDKARVKVRTNKPGLALWLADLFGPLTSRVEVVEREVDGLDADEWEQSRSAAFATINHPELVVMLRRWRDGPPPDYAATTSPTRLAVIYALAGWVDSRGRACLPMGGSGLSEQSIRRLGQGFDPTIRDQKEGPLLTLGAVEQFGQYLAAGAVPLPLAGAEEKFIALGITSEPAAEAD
jgi:hypothetical protein